MVLGLAAVVAVVSVVFIGGGFVAFSRAATALCKSDISCALLRRHRETYSRKLWSSLPSISFRMRSSSRCFSRIESRKSTSSSSSARNWFPAYC
ncbi:hypothetical protein K474DRAFT_292860 [Panus rudis PR-1116 ss-1]|nr:hypothetical protein K474DRAFT_292860 [Panus rudis PR-1116 ss-1]